MAAPPAPHRLECRRSDVSRRGPAGHTTRRLPRGQALARRAVPTDRAKVPHRLLDHTGRDPPERARSRALPDRGPADRGRALVTRGAPGAARVRGRLGERGRRPGLRRLLAPGDGLPHAAAVRDRHRRIGSGAGPQALAHVLRWITRHGHPARGDLEGRHANPVFRGEPQERAVPRHHPDAAHRLRRLRGLRAPVLQRHRRQRAGSSGAACWCSPTSAVAASSAPSGIRRG
jgi:hypothetical protein